MAKASMSASVSLRLRTERIREDSCDAGELSPRSSKYETDHLAAHLRDRHRLAEQRLRRGRAERHDKIRLHQRQFVVQPPAAGLDLAGIRLGMDAALAARLELEVLHRIGDVGLRAGRCRPRRGRRRTPCRRGRRRACRRCPPGRRAVRRRTRRLAFSGPSPNTVWVASRHSGQRRQPLAASRNSAIESARAVIAAASAVGLRPVFGLNLGMMGRRRRRHSARSSPWRPCPRQRSDQE